MENVNPQCLRDGFLSLDADNKMHFMNLLAPEIGPGGIFLMLCKLDTSQKKRYQDLCYKMFAWKFFPALLKEARRFARELSDVSDDEFDRRFGERIKLSN